MSSNSSVSIPIQPLRKNQSIENWRRTYKASVALLDEKQALALLPSYVCRTKGDQILAEVAAKETSLTKALDQLQVLIDGEISEFTWISRFCEAKPAELSVSSQTAFFFELLAIAASAGFTAQKAVVRFLNVIPSGKNTYHKIKGDINADMDDDAAFALFKRIQPFLKENDSQEELEVSIKGESDSFMVCPESDEIAKLRDHVLQLEDKVNQQLAADDSESSHSETQENHTFFEKTSKAKNNRKCNVCGKKGHDREYCWKRICENCSGKGHDTDKCPSRKFSKGSKL